MQTRDGRPVKKGRDAMAGPDDSYCGYGKGWANVSNTPFREYKHFVHEGGIASPLVLSWPDGIDAGLNGSLVWTPAHIIDVMATCVDISGADYPESMNGKTILPLEGMSLKPLLTGKGFESDRELFFEHHLNSAIRSGNWKLVRKGNPRQKEVFRWELYDLSGDRTEMKNLADEKPEIVEKLKSEWYKWAERSLVIPGPYYN